jgi:hypothetical protein
VVCPCACGLVRQASPRSRADRRGRSALNAFTAVTKAGSRSMYVLRRPPQRLPVSRCLRSRAALSLATRDAFSNCAMATSTCRTSTAVSVSSTRKSGAVAGISVTPRLRKQS